MSKNAYIGVEGVARKIKKMYVGVDGVARKVKKAYVGVNGVARLFFKAGGELKYLGTLEQWTTPVTKYAAAGIEKYVMFGGGQTSSSSAPVGNVYAYDRDLVMTSPLPFLTSFRTDLAAAGLDEHVIFAGGYAYRNSPKRRADADAYDQDLTRKTPSDIGTGRDALVGAHNGTYMIFAGGATGADYSSFVSTATFYTSDLVRAGGNNLGKAVIDHAAAGNEEYALFAGGRNEAYDVAYVNAIDNEGGRSIITALSKGRANLAAGANSKWFLFAGGYDPNATPSTQILRKEVDVYDSELVKKTNLELPRNTSEMMGSGTESFILFAGGIASTGTNKSTTVYAYDEDLVLTNPADLSHYREGAMAATNGKHIIFGSGSTGYNAWGTAIDVYDTDE